MSKPSDICLTLATITNGGWLCADEVRGRLQHLGWEDLSAQQVSAYLRRLSKMPVPPVEMRSAAWGAPWREYRITPCGRTWLHNLLPWAREWPR